MSFYDAIRVGASGAKDFEVKRSLRFIGEGTHLYLERTPSSAGNRQVCTFSCWTKRSNIGVNHCLASAYSANNNNDNISIILRSLSSGNCSLRVVGYFHNFRITNAAFRDPSAWLHVVVAIDTRQSSADDRIKVYVNGVQETSFSTSGNVTQNMNLAFNDTSVHRIGTQSNQLSNTADGYIAEVNFIDGQQLTPASFAETNADTGQWVPIDTSGLTFGTNGYRLQFEDNSGTTATTLGKDTSGNGNNFTPNNFVTGDAVKDSPTNNFCTLNTLNSQNTNLSEGNLKAEITNASGNRTTVATMGSKSGKWYYEVLYNSQTGDGVCIGFGDESYNALYGNNKLFEDHSPSVGYYGASNGFIYYNTSRTEYSTDFTAGDIIGVAADLDNNQIYFYKNGTVHPNANPFSYTFSDTIFIPAIGNLTSGGNRTITANFGQDSTFAGAKTAQGNTDANGKGDFYYSVPSGFKALCSANLPDPTILLPNKYFDTKLFTGNGSSQTISGLNFAPDWVWIKNRNSSSQRSHILTDRVRGATKSLLLPETDAEGTFAQDLTAFTSDGFSVGSNGRVNENSTNLVAWNWDAGETDSATYIVKVVSDSGNKYRFNDFGTSAVTLDLAEGGTYTFDQSDSSMSSHPMQLSTTANGTHGGGSAYSTGVTYQLDGSTVTASAFISGFSSASSRKLIITVAASAPTLYYYCYYHSGMGGQANTNSTLGSSNFDGTLQATVKANPTAGFSIVSYTVSNFSGMTMGHGLGVAPVIAISKKRSGTSDWSVQFINKLDNSTDYMFLNKTDAKGDTSTYFTSTTVKDGFGSGSNGDTIIQYVFSEVSGYSKLGAYTGNGSSDGTFVFTGFRPAWVMTKSTTLSSTGWLIYDTARSTFNEVTVVLQAHVPTAEVTAASIDILSNGFKFKTTDNAVNGSGQTYIYLAFAESPFKNARAR